MALIELKDIEKSFRDGEEHQNYVLRKLSMKVEAGEFVAIKGRSGSGKTTLLSILGTLLRPDCGSYLFNGQELTTPNLDLSKIRNTQIGFLFQDHRLMPQFTVLENILLPKLASCVQSEPSDIEYANKLMELMRISQLSGQFPETLSGGEASRVAACRALFMKPLLLLADEPTGQLDSDNAHHIVSLFKEINSALHTTIIMVTHADDTAAAAGRILTLKEGMLI